ncbi:hypothetical protein T440DRAFT_467339 [Plenodomus tracheiphilus IPT5]|uniref:Uncharacterized protein n=1 Tax=Plenodomus tracheiphilus IPT5 TaxID=1408161 RepID=A0A6A7B9E0_9PLEO|nr:hypothetical protein T440DRAFT_467339 [Plenodomus tracheiphilus IPT5]
MTNDDDHNPRRAPSRPEDNPFIAFRRFADSQVSSLLNTVFTLPATIANYNNAHQAREQCLFGKADERQCDKLHEIEAETAELRREGRELFREGDIQAVLKHSETLLKLERKAEEIRRDIVEEATRNGDIKDDGRDKVALVERVASQKGRDWGAEWDWGIPKPFDSERRAMQDNEESERSRELQEWEILLRLQSEVQRLVAAFDGAAWDDPPRQQSSETRTEHDDAQDRPWGPSWGFPIARDAVNSNAGGSWREAYEHLTREDQSDRHQRSRIAEAHDDPSYEYSHDHEDQHDEPPSPKVNCTFAGQQQQLQRADHVAETTDASYHNQTGEETEMDAYEHLVAGFDKFNSVAPTQRDGATGTPSILSTLTTTERTVTPDGLVTTKVVLKKRFADGREESSETIHTQKGEEMNPRSQRSWQTTDQPQIPSNGVESKGKNGSRNGWFWSS